MYVYRIHHLRGILNPLSYIEMLIYLNDILHILLFNRKERFSRIKQVKIKNIKIKTTIMLYYNNIAPDYAKKCMLKTI